MITRRRFHHLAVGGIALGAGLAAPAGAAERIPPMLLENGQYTQPWFAQSFLDLADDLAEATKKGKRLALLWEQEGCPYCRETHVVNFAIPEIRSYVKDNFDIVQLDIWGSRNAVDFDGQAMAEKKLARRGQVRFTPTIQFITDDPEAWAGKSAKAAEVARMPGYFRPFHFLVMFQYVREKAYADGDFPSFLKKRTAALESAGKKIPAW